MLYSAQQPTYYTQPILHPMSAPNPPNPPSRKRPAPGAVPLSMQNPYINRPNPTNHQLTTWNSDNLENFLDNSAANLDPYNMMSSPRQTQFSTQGIQAPSNALAAPSNALARRGINNQLVPSNRPYSQQQADPWGNFADENLLPPQNGNNGLDDNDNVEVLEEKAQRAKREAQAKRKQIPPFVQKLNSFLEESKNTELIRWSEKGDSFIVLDEDEFAKTLIPELFKHNNYASFVRQLNMYGFHKKVGLSDNSMKASERKNKSPSEYYNPYFRRGHPNLLWLINKPKGGANKRKTKRPEDGDDSDDDNIPEEVLSQNIIQPQSAPITKALPAPESGPLQKKEMAVVRDQITLLQEQQRTIHDAITRLRREHIQLTQQAAQFQEMHNRHENSINAILTFLANVFRKPLEEGGVVRDINDLFSGIIPNLQMPQQGQGGSVVDLGDWDQQSSGSMTNLTATPKRQQRLLPPIPQPSNIKRSPSTSSATPRPGHTTYTPQQPQMGTVTELFDTPGDSVTSPTYSAAQKLEANPQEGMMKIMQDVNTNASTGNSPINLPDVGSSPAMTNDQRNRMLSLMSGGQGAVGQSPPNAGYNASPTPLDTTSARSSAPPTTGPMSLSPIMGSSVLPPSLQQISQNQEELGRLQKLQEEQASRLDELSSLLGPYSPSGKIDGLADGNNQYFDDNIDFGQYLDPTAYNADGLPTDFDFGTTNFDSTNVDPLGTSTFDSTADFGGSLNDANRIVETNTPSHNSGTEDSPRDELENSPGRSAKRQRQN